MVNAKYSEYVTIPVQTNHAIIRLSGGADSALLFYLMCDAWYKIRRTQENVFHPVCVIHEKRPWQSFHAQQVCDFMEETFRIDIKPLRTKYCKDPGGKPDNPKNKNRYVDFQEQLIDEIVEEVGETCQVFNGVTANPPAEIGEKYWGSSQVFGDNVWDCREKHRDWEVKDDRKLIDDDSARSIIHCNPFIQSHKGHIAELYRRHGLLDTLLPLTRSCEGWDYMTNGFTTECGECWWCFEKEWAFKKWQENS